LLAVHDDAKKWSLECGHNHSTFGTNENKISFLFVNLIYVSKLRNSLET
jgi:hypothetical protein